MLRQFRQKLNQSSLEKKLVTIVSLIIVLTVGTFGILSFLIVKHRYESMLYQSMATSSSLITHELTNSLNDTIILSDIIRSDKTIQKHLDLIQKGGNYKAADSYNTLYTSQQSYFQQHKQKYLSYSVLINPYFSCYTYGFGYTKLTAPMIGELSRSAEQLLGAPIWISNYAKDGQLFLARQIKKIEGLELTDLGTLAIAVDMDQLLSEITKESRNFQNIYWAFSQNNQIIYCSDELSGITWSQIEKFHHPNGPITVNNRIYFALRGHLDGPDWEYLQLIPYDEISHSQTILLCSYFVIFLFILLFTILLIHFSIKRITVDIRLLYQKMKSFRGDNAEVITMPYTYSERTDEIGLLHQYFDSMAKEIETLINNDYKLKIEMKNMQLKTLEAQINPHFLYNTLESINWRAKACKNEEISQMVESLGTLLRASLSNKESLVPLKEELELVQCYLTIQKIRFEERLQYDYAIDQQLLSVLIPPLCIQPLVENAIKYGLEEMLDGCRIQIQVLKKEHFLCITVRNNGSLFEENLLEKLQNSSKYAHGIGMGLLNIHQRVKLLFGPESGLKLYNENGYAVAAILIASNKS